MQLKMGMGRKRKGRGGTDRKVKKRKWEPQLG
jgi:hypothetical protein